MRNYYNRLFDCSVKIVQDNESVLLDCDDHDVIAAETKLWGSPSTSYFNLKSQKSKVRIINIMRKYESYKGGDAWLQKFNHEKKVKIQLVNMNLFSFTDNTSNIVFELEPYLAPQSSQASERQP